MTVNAFQFSTYEETVLKCAESCRKRKKIVCAYLCTFCTFWASFCYMTLIFFGCNAYYYASAWLQMHFITVNVKKLCRNVQNHAEKFNFLHIFAFFAYFYVHIGLETYPIVFASKNWSRNMCHTCIVNWRKKWLICKNRKTTLRFSWICVPYRIFWSFYKNRILVLRSL